MFLSLYPFLYSLMTTEEMLCLADASLLSFVPSTAMNAATVNAQTRITLDLKSYVITKNNRHCG